MVAVVDEEIRLLGGTESLGANAQGKYLAVCFIEVTEIGHERL